MSDTDTIDLLGQSTVQETVFVLDRFVVPQLFGEQATAYGTSVTATVPITPSPVRHQQLPALSDLETNEAGATYLMERAGGAETATITA